MRRSFLCPCGCQFQIPPGELSQAVRCPTCQRSLLVPAERPSRLPTAWLILGSALGMGLLVLVGLLVLLGRELNDKPARQHPGSPGLAQAVPHESAPAAEENDLRRMVSPEQRQGLPAALKPLPAPVVSRTAPAEARVGQPFTLFLTSAAGPERQVTYQYRTKAGDPWRAAPGGRVQLERLGPGPLHLEFRVVDSRGQPSSVGTQLLNPQPEPRPIVEVGRWHVGDHFYQEVIFARQSTGQALGIAFHDNARFALLSSFHVDKITTDGILVTQKVEAVRLIQSPNTLTTGLEDLLRQAEGKTFRLTIGSDGAVKRFDGNARAAAVQRQQQVDSSRFLMQTALDKDSWKELASLTFFQPPTPAPKEGRWSRQLEHTWGPLGQWTGQIAYQTVSLARGRYDYRLQLTYHPPDRADSTLPFQVDRSSFRLLQGDGTIQYDVTRGRVGAAEEHFRVRGVLAISALGVQAPVEMEETQTFRLRVFDQVLDAWRRPVQGR